MNAGTLELSSAEYELFRRLVYAQSGINLGEQKAQLVKTRLGKLVRSGGFESFRAYYQYVQRDSTGEELSKLLDAISTNTTHLFREMRHFKLLGGLIGGWVRDSSWRARNDTLRIWSAGCSSGEEPYSIAMVAHSALSTCQTVGLRILATDLSVQVLSKARLGIFEGHRLGTVPADFKRRYLKRVRKDDGQWHQVVPELRQLITFSRFNLMTEAFPFKRGFHVIFCRNVMIYFDRATQQKLVKKFAEQLLPGGYLLIGHSESLNSFQQPLTYVEPTVYRKD